MTGFLYRAQRGDASSVVRTSRPEFFYSYCSKYSKGKEPITVPNTLQPSLIWTHQAVLCAPNTLLPFKWLLWCHWAVTSPTLSFVCISFHPELCDVTYLHRSREVMLNTPLWNLEEVMNAIKLHSGDFPQTLRRLSVLDQDVTTRIIRFFLKEDRIVGIKYSVRGVTCTVWHTVWHTDLDNLNNNNKSD